MLSGFPPAGADVPPPWDAETFSAEAATLLAAAAAVPADDEDGVRFLLRERFHGFDGEGRGTIRQRFLFRLLTETGVDGWSTWSVSWQPWHQERPEIRARVVSADGSEHWLDPATLAEAPVGGDRNVLSDRLQLQAPLPGVAVGAVVELTTEVRDTAPLFSHGVVDRFFFGVQLPVERSRLILEAPPELELTWTQRLLPDLEPEETTVEGRRRWRFEAGPKEAVEVEPLTPEDVPVWPLVGYTTGRSWAQVATAYSEIVERQIGGFAPAEIVAAAVGEAGAPFDKVARLVGWLHREIRYTGIEFGEAAIVPRSPAETLERTFGDCKDKSTLLVALLRNAGVDAYLALLDSGTGQDLEPELPGLGVFDHAIVYLPELDLWIDATDPFSAVGEIPVGTQGRLALVASPATTELRRTPAAGPEQNRSVETREIYLAADLGGSRVVEITEAWGSISRGLRQRYAALEDSEIETMLTDYMESTYLSDGLIGWETSDPRVFDGPFRLRIEADEAERGFTDLAEAAVVIEPIYLLERLPNAFWQEDEEEETEPADPANGEEIATPGRQVGAALPNPYSAEWRYRIVPPAGYRPVDLPESLQRALGPATLNREVRTTDGGDVEIILSFSTGPRRLSAEDFEALRAGALELRDDDNLLIEFEQVGEAHLAAGEIREALAEFDRLIAMSPERALPRARRARALLEAGLGEAARAEARRAVELEQEYDIAYQTLGVVLEHDLLGRELRGDFDREGALAAFRKARELDPENGVTGLHLAILLEHDADGNRYADGADLELAIEEYRRIREKGHGVDENLALALAHAGRYGELLELVEEMRTADSGALELVALALAKSPSAAVRRARQLDDPQNATALAAAGALVALRHYAPSAEIFAAASRGSANAAAVLNLAETLRKTRRWEETEIDLREPLGVIQRMMMVFFQEDIDGYLDLLGPEVRFEDEERDEFRKGAALLRSSLRASDVPIDTVIDLAVSGLTVNSDGEPGIGYRVYGRWDLGDESHDMTVYMILEGGEFRLLASSEDAAELGGEVLRRLERGDLAAARRWLDWAREDVASGNADDPWSGHPMTRFWKRGDEGDEASMRAAAAALAASTRPDEVVKILRQGRENAASEAARSGYELALVWALSELEKPAEIVPIVEGWLAADPTSATAFHRLASALVDLERWDDLARAAKERLARQADDPDALWALAGVAVERADYEEAERLHRRRIELGKADATDHERLAWLDLMAGTVDDDTLAAAQQAASVANFTDVGVLQTLAAVYAELGRGTEAREVLLQKLSLAAADSPRSHEWYVLGRIAESYGVLDAARDAYARVEPEEDSPRGLPTYHRLAQERLADLAEDSA